MHERDDDVETPPDPAALLAERVADVARQVAWWRGGAFVAAGLLLTLIAVRVGGWAQPHTLVLRSLSVVDPQGRARLELGLDRSDSPHLELREESGQVLAAVESTLDNSGRFSLFDDRSTRVLFDVTPGRYAALQLLSGRRGTTASFYRNGHLAPGIFLKDQVAGTSWTFDDRGQVRHEIHQP